MLTGLVGGVFLVPLTATAAHLGAKHTTPTSTTTLPAVDGINAKIDGFGGTLANKSLTGAQGVMSIPLGTQFGLQVDGVAGSYDRDFFGTAAAHLFWRNPSQALLGLYASYTHWDRFGGVNVSQVGGEGYVYWNQWSFGGIAGVESGSSTSSVVGTFLETYDVKTRFFDKIDLTYYWQPNVKFSIGHRYAGGKNALALGTEWGLNVGRGTMGSLFAEGRIGEGDYQGVWGGLRLYFGQKDKPLVARHRQDDPPGTGPDSLFTIMNNFNKKSLPSTPTGGGGCSGPGLE